MDDAIWDQIFKLGKQITFLNSLEKFYLPESERGKKLRAKKISLSKQLDALLGQLG